MAESPDNQAWLHLPRPGELPPLAAVGGKARNLARLAAAGCDVPRWVAVRAEAFDRFAASGELPAEFRAAVLAALEAACLRDAWLAVRSSAVEEDGATASYAGQFATVLGVRAGEDGAALWDALRRVWASAASPHAAAYRERQGVPTQSGLAVILQELVEPAVSGVAFSADPVSGDRSTAVVSAVYGLGEGLVSGELPADTYRVRGETVTERSIARKEVALRLDPAGGLTREPLPEALREAPTLTDAEALRIAGAARTLAEAFGEPQDVEWALLESGVPTAPGLVLLQTRPVTALPEARGERRLWDNSNIAESYGGVTTPLTFSFARAVYEDVYLQFCRLVGVPEFLLARHRQVFANMLGLVRGRIYYNLLNWYRTLALLPGYGVNRAFMERMMGVREKLADPPEPPRTGSRARDAARVARMLARLLREALRLRRESAAFQARVAAALAPLANEALEERSPDELAALYHRLEEELLRHWRPPLVNDFFAMLAFGLLGRLAERWLPGAPPSLVNDLLCGEGGIVSTQPAREALRLAKAVAADPALRELFQERDAGELWRRLREEPCRQAFRAQIDAYLEKFGDRCLGELKLETVTLREDPRFLLETIGAYAQLGVESGERGGESRETALRVAAEAEVGARLRGMRGWLFRRLLGVTRARIRDRENLRFARTRVFGLARRIFLAFGHRLALAGRLDSPRDVFYLTREELLGWVNGTAPGAGFRALVAARRAEFAAYENEPPPPDRFETWGPPEEWGVGSGEWRVGSEEREERLEAGGRRSVRTPHSVLRGTGCCAGVVRAPVRVVRDPRQPGELAGRILVAERTDPGWTLLFPAARGLLVERGSLLSHSAIVARETGLPCVVGIAGLLATLEDGEIVEMDGAAGTVRRCLPK